MNGLREVVDVVVLEVVVHVDEDVVVQESEQARTGMLPKNLIARLSRARSRFGGNCSRKQCARKACVRNGREQQHRGRKERSPKQEYVGVRMRVCARGGSPLI
jgi:hypothetical protein